MLQEDDDGLAMQDDDETTEPAAAPPSNGYPPRFHVLGGFPVTAEAASQADKPLEQIPECDRQWVGVNGRCNKVADTCYTFWVGGTLGVRSSISSKHPTYFDRVFASDAQQSLPARLQWHPPISLGEDSAYDRRLWQDARRSSR